MRVTKPVGAVVLLSLAVAGCSSSTEKSTPVAPVEDGTQGVPGETTAPPALAAPGRTRTKTAPLRPPAKRVRIKAPSIDRFVAEAQRQMPQFFIDRRDDEVAELGEIACRSLAAGKRNPAAAQEITAYGVAVRDARELVMLARATACRP